MKMLNKITDLVAIGAGYVSVDPHANILQPAHNMLAALPVDPGAVSEILKMVVGLIIGLLSKFLYGIIDKKLKKTNQVQPSVAPDSLTFNKTTNEKESK